VAGIINWKKATIPAGNPDSDHSYVGIDSADNRLYSKDSSGTTTKYPTQSALNSKAGLQPATTQAGQTTNTTTTSATFNLMSGMSITPPAGTYLVHFSTSLQSNSSDALVRVAIYSGGTQQPVSIRNCQPRVDATGGFGGNSSLDVRTSISTQCEVTVNGSQAIECRWSTSGGTATANQRTLNIIRIYK
jgi:hypothetical protein